MSAAASFDRSRRARAQRSMLTGRYEWSNLVARRRLGRVPPRKGQVMTEQRTFERVTPEVWARIRKLGTDRYGTVYEPPEGDQGRATTRTPIGDVVLAYDVDAARGTVTYTLERKPFLISASQIWSGLEAAIDRCCDEA
jgi:hypothetical protein